MGLLRLKSEHLAELNNDERPVHKSPRLRPDLLYLCMRKSFETQPALFVSSTALDHPSLHGLEVNRQLEDQHIIMTEGRVNIIGATPIEATRSGSGNGVEGCPTKNDEAGWHVKQDSRGKLKPTYGYSVHIHWGC